MTWKTRFLAVGLAVAALGAPSVRAADHRDSPGPTADPASDINDVYAWMSGDTNTAYLVMTVFPVADTNSKFSDRTLYAFHLGSRQMYLQMGAVPVTTDVICSFDSGQRISCWVGRSGQAPAEYVTGNANTTSGLASTSGKLKVYAGLRDDPFFFNLDGFNAVRAAVKMAAPMLTFVNGCPTLPAATAGALAGQLAMKPMGGAPTDFFATLNTLAIVVAIDKTLLNGGGPITGVWAGTHQKVQ